MAKAKEELQRADIKVNVNCCDGCKRKVLKALDIKGVLKTEIHQSLLKITVTGNFDIQILLKRLAKVGKAAEIIPPEETKEPQKEETKKSNDSDEKEKPKEEEVKDESKHKDAEESEKSDSDRKDDDKSKNMEENKEENKDKNKNKIHHAVITATPNYSISARMVSANPPPSMYYQTVLMPYYSMNNRYYEPIPFVYRGNQYHEASLYQGLPPELVQSEPTVFTEYFDDDNTASCHVM